MRKLRLESLRVESFETTAAAPVPRGTVQAHADESGASVCLCQGSEGWECQTWDFEACGDTNYLDCTYACSGLVSCQAC